MRNLSQNPSSDDRNQGFADSIEKRMLMRCIEDLRINEKEVAAGLTVVELILKNAGRMRAYF